MLDYNFQMPGQALSDGPEPDFATPYWTNIVNSNQAMGTKERERERERIKETFELIRLKQTKIAYMSSPIGHLENFTSPILIIVKQINKLESNKN